ncbi:alpha/beta hydrolase [Fulvivirga sp. 29W222]|uniref:Alpha/beta hydrolase n=1 Tax=Fulvivirga marina TaxID=2494733 RepID=A0A937FX57_9BACT|nr:alpha/beta hydrolase [Fulvivirga marina]MBL6446153.1 alpha/beta hydrolase [Fulvivirga marina]
MKKLIFLASAVLLIIHAYAQQSFEIDKSGNGTPVLLLPGFTCPGEIWDETVMSLGSNFQYHQVSYAGFNGIEPINMPWYETIKGDLKTYITEQNLGKVIIIGHSMGGMLAMDIAAESPQLVEKLILVDALPCLRQLMMPHMKAEDITFDNPYNQRMLTMSDEDFHQNAKYMASSMTNQPEKVEQLIAWIEEADRKTYAYGYTELLKIDLRDDISSIKAETLIIAADFPSKEMVSKGLNDQFEKLSSKEIRIADRSKHFIMFDQKDWFTTQVKEFLQQ